MTSHLAQRTFAALVATATAAAVGGIAHADTLVVTDADTLTTGAQTSLDFGTVSCGTTVHRTVAVAAERVGNGNIFLDGSTVSVGRSSTTPVVPALTIGTGSINIPTGWGALSGSSNATTSPINVDFVVSATTAGPVSQSVALDGSGTVVKPNGTQSAWTATTTKFTVTWTVGPCSVPKTDTVTTVACNPTVTYTGTALEPCTATVTGDNGFTQSLPVAYGNNTNAGTATASASFAGDATHNASQSSATFTIAKAPSTTAITCDPQTVTYTGAPLTPCTATTTGAGGLSASPVPSYTGNTDAGTASVTAGYGGDDNHFGSSDQATFTIDPADATCTVIGYTGTYDGLAHGATGTCTGLNGADLSTGLDLGQSFTDVSGGTANWAFSAANYKPQSGTAQIALAQADSSIAITCKDATYDGTAQTPCTATVTGAGGLSGDVPVDYTDNINAGVQTATATANFAGDKNHKGSTASTTFTINRAPSTTVVSCPATPIMATGSAITPCTARVTGAGGLDQGLDVSYADNIKYGTASATATYIGDDNHSGSTDTGHFTILQWTVSGFAKPVDMGNVLNIVKAGSTVPLKFVVSAGSTPITDAATLGASFAMKAVSCSTSAPISDDLSTFTTTGGTALRYDPTGAQWIQNWQAPTKTGQCYVVTVTTADGSTMAASFKTK